MSYVILRNPHDDEYKLFTYEEGKELYSPNYGCPICSGSSVDDVISDAANFGISSEEIEVVI